MKSTNDYSSDKANKERNSRDSEIKLMPTAP